MSQTQKWDACKITDTNSNQRLMLAHKHFKLKMIFWAATKYGMLLSIRKNLEKMIRGKYRRATPEIPVFFNLRCLKCTIYFNELISSNTQLNTKTKQKQLCKLKTARNGKYLIFRGPVSVFTTYNYFLNFYRLIKIFQICWRRKKSF